MSSHKRRVPATAVILTDRALRDIRAIERYSLHEWGRKVADKYVDDIQAALDRLRTNPDLARQEPEFSVGLRFYRVRKHFLVCAMLNQHVYILALLHTSMDLPTRLAELEPQLMAEAEWLHERLRGDQATN